MLSEAICSEKWALAGREVVNLSMHAENEIIKDLWVKIQGVFIENMRKVVANSTQEAHGRLPCELWYSDIYS